MKKFIKHSTYYCTAVAAGFVLLSKASASATSVSVFGVPVVTAIAIALI